MNYILHLGLLVDLVLDGFAGLVFLKVFSLSRALTVDSVAGNIVSGFLYKSVVSGFNVVVSEVSEMLEIVEL